MSEQPKGFITASHSVLFEDQESHRCDVCKDALDAKPAEEDETETASGRGVFMWSRGGERRYQESPLCSQCATAIGVNAYQRWEIEEEEG